MKLKLTRHALAAALITFSLSGAALAQPETTADAPVHGQHHRGDRLPEQFEALGLSDSQKAQIKLLHEARWAQKKQTRAADKALYESLRSLSPAAPNYTAEADRIATLMGQRHAEKIRERAELRAQQWAILTPSQQAQLAAMPAPEPRNARWHDNK